MFLIIKCRCERWTKIDLAIDLLATLIYSIQTSGWQPTARGTRSDFDKHPGEEKLFFSVQNSKNKKICERGHTKAKRLPSSIPIPILFPASRKSCCLTHIQKLSSQEIFLLERPRFPSSLLQIASSYFVGGVNLLIFSSAINIQFSYM